MRTKYVILKINFSIEGEGDIIGVDNGNQTSHESFKASYRKVFNGLALAIIQSREKTGNILIMASGDGLEGSQLEIKTK